MKDSTGFVRNLTKDLSEHEFWESIFDITLDKPRRAEQIYVSENWKDRLMLAKTEKGLTDKLVLEYKNKPAKFKKSYEKQEKDELARYDINKGLVHKFILNPSDISLIQSPFSLFKEVYLKKNDRNLDESAETAWSNLSDFQKEVWAERLHDEESALENMFFHESISVTQNLIYIRDIIDELALSLPDARESWYSITEETKAKFNMISIKENREKDRLKDLYEMRNGFYPEKPLDPFNQFLKDFLNSHKNPLNIKENLSKVHKLWISADDKARSYYMLKNKIDQLRYDIKKEYFETIKKTEQKATAFKLFVRDRIRVIDLHDIDFTNHDMINKLKSEWLGLANCFKERYRFFAKTFNCTEQGLKDNSKDIINKPIKPLSAFSVFIKEKLSINNKSSKNNGNETFKMHVEEWKSLSDNDRKRYEEASLSLREEYNLIYKDMDAVPVGKSITSKSKSKAKSQEKEKENVDIVWKKTLRPRKKKNLIETKVDDSDSENEEIRKPASKTVKSQRRKK